MTPETPTPQTNAWLQRLNNWKLPIIVSGGFLGATIGGIVISMYMPMFALIAKMSG